MMDLCTVISENFIPQAINLIQSYRHLSYNENIYLYYFNTDREKLDIFSKLFGEDISLIEIKNVCEHALNPRAFFYKVYAIRDCLHNHAESMIYSDSANCFIRDAKNIHKDLIDESLFLSYPYERLTNKYWTTKKCFEVFDALGAEIMPQYWAGFQVYRRTAQNMKFVQDMYDYMINPDAALPDTTSKKPDGSDSICIEHRQDQSVLSLLIHKENRHQFYDVEKNNKYGDWQTFVEFDKNYKHDFNRMILSPRESKFGKFRFIKQ